jgi:hypothetical protein
MIRSKTAKALCVGVWFLVVALACNLTTDSTPPTLVPLQPETSTPPPTLGFSTLSPEELPDQAETPSAPQVDPQLVSLVNMVEKDRLMFHVDALQNFRTRHVNSSYSLPHEGIGAAHDYILNQFEQIKAQSGGRLQVFSHPFNVTWGGIRSEARNVVAHLTGTEMGAGTIIIGAHYDSISINFEDGQATAPGANDNASGVSAMIELARILSTREHRTSIMFVAFSAEEVGRIGSKAFINEYLSPRQIGPDQINVMINLDMLGSHMGNGGLINDRDIRIFSEGPNETSRARQVARGISLIAANHAPDMELKIVDGIDRQGRYGDHMSFSEAGYTAVRIMQALEDASRQHNERDTIDGLQADYFTRITRTVLTIVVSLADGLRPPQNLALRDAANGLRTLVWEPVPGASGYIVGLRPPEALYYQYFPVEENSITWDGFVPERFAGVVISARDANGLMGPTSAEFPIR